MNFIEPKVKILRQKYDDDILTNMFKHIELCGRNCYKSEDRITDTSYEKFVDNLTKSEHGAMLEHGTVYLTIPVGTPVDDPQYMWKIDIVRFFIDNKYSKVNKKTVNDTVDVEIKGYGFRTQASARFYYITTNWRVIIENKDFNVVKYISHYHIKSEQLEESVLQWISKPTDDHIKRYTVEFTYHLAAARDVNRHRVQSIAEESTRYCDYTKEKFAGGINVVRPLRLNSEDIKESYNDWNVANNIFFDMCSAVVQTGTDDWTDIDWWLFSNIVAQESYYHLKNDFHWSNQECSLVLPLDTKTCSIHTAFVDDWCHFFNLRALGTTGAPRPCVKCVAWPLMEVFLKNNIINEDMINKEKYHQLKEKYPNIEDYIRL